MVDQAKRNTLKNVAGISVGAVAAVTSTTAFSKLNNLPTDTPQSAGSGLADIKVSTRVSSQANELEVVLTNAGAEPANMTGMTPSVINTARGRFNFAALFNNGPVQLAPGESISVPMQHHPVALNALNPSGLAHSSTTLSDALKQRISIVTDGDSFAAVNLVRSIAVA